MNFEPELEREYRIDFVRPATNKQHTYITTKSLNDAEEELRLMRELSDYKNCDIRIAEIEKTVRWIKYSLFYRPYKSIWRMV